ncbi:MAG TPA: hypothetical protein VM099_14650 [Gemmatimonadaceae bacterium]|nr:hypothetical protein [Gemmatimonadaceae bacterium]
MILPKLFRVFGRQQRAVHAAAPVTTGVSQMIAEMKAEDLRRELAKPIESLPPHEERQQTAYWRLWRTIRSSALSTIPPAQLDGYVPEHVSLAMSVVGEFDSVREKRDVSGDSLYRSVALLPYPKDVIKRCCEFLIQLADRGAPSFNADHALLADERDSLGLALFSLDYFVESEANELSGSSRANVVKPQPGDAIARRGTDEPEAVDQVIGVGENNEWMVMTKSGASMQVTQSASGSYWEEVTVVAPGRAAWLTFTPPLGIPSLDS